MPQESSGNLIRQIKFCVIALMSIVPLVPLNYVLAAYAFLKTRGGDDAELADLLMKEAVGEDMRRRIAKAVSSSCREIGYAISVSDLGSVRDKLSAFLEVSKPIWASSTTLSLDERTRRSFAELTADRPSVRFCALADGSPAVVLQSRQAVADLIPGRTSRRKTVRLFRIRAADADLQYYGTAYLRRISSQEVAVLPEGTALMETFCASMSGETVGIETVLSLPRKGSRRAMATPNFRLRYPDGLLYRVAFRMPQMDCAEPSLPIFMKTEHLLGHFYIFGSEPLPVSANLFDRISERLWWFGGSVAEMNVENGFK